jgi:hypothetical protein
MLTYARSVVSGLKLADLTAERVSHSDGRMPGGRATRIGLVVTLLAAATTFVMVVTPSLWG